MILFSRKSFNIILLLKYNNVAIHRRHWIFVETRRVPQQNINSHNEFIFFVHRRIAHLGRIQYYNIVVYLCTVHKLRYTDDAGFMNCCTLKSSHVGLAPRFTFVHFFFPERKQVFQIPSKRRKNIKYNTCNCL